MRSGWQLTHQLPTRWLSMRSRSRCPRRASAPTRQLTSWLRLHCQSHPLRDPLAASRMATPTPWLTWAAAVWAAARSARTSFTKQILRRSMLCRTELLIGCAPVGWRPGIWFPAGPSRTSLHCGPLAMVRVQRRSSPEAASVSVKKISRVLGMPLILIDSDPDERINLDTH